MNAATRAMRNILLRSQTLKDFIANDTGHAIRPGDSSQDDRVPYVLLWRISDRPVQELAGPTGVRIAIVQVDYYANTKTQAAAMAALGEAAVSSFRRGNADDVWVAEITEANSRSREEPDPLGGDRLLGVEQTDYRLTYLDNNPPTL